MEDKKKQIRTAVKGNKTARAMYGKNWYPSLIDFKKTFRINLIRNLPVTISDVEIAEYIWGKDTISLKEKQFTKDQP